MKTQGFLKKPRHQSVLMLLVIIAMGLSLLDQSSFACVPLAITLVILASSIKKNSENEMSFSQEQSQTDATYTQTTSECGF